MKSQNRLSAREALKVPLPQAYNSEAPFRQQITLMEEQHKTMGILFIALVVFTGAAILYLNAYYAKAWKLDPEK
jgi:hypothetical protein